MKNNFNFTESEMTFVTKAEQYCATGEQCRSAVRDKLLTWGANQVLRERIVEYLTENDFINEERYCRIYCESKLRLQKWGRVKIEYQLRSKRIDNSTIKKPFKKSTKRNTSAHSAPSRKTKTTASLNPTTKNVVQN